MSAQKCATVLAGTVAGWLLSLLNTGTPVLFIFFLPFCTRGGVCPEPPDPPWVPTIAGVALQGGLVPVNSELGDVWVCSHSRGAGDVFCPDRPRAVSSSLAGLPAARKAQQSPWDHSLEFFGGPSTTGEAPSAGSTVPCPRGRLAASAGPRGTGPGSPGISLGPVAKPPRGACPSTEHVGIVLTARARPRELWGGSPK